MGITSYITELLEENEYVVIPGLGAFISTYQPAKFEGENHILLPPSRLISFNPDLRIDDGILQNYLVHQMKITQAQARKLLEQYTDDIAYHLQTGETVVLDKLGILSKTGNTIHFEPENKAGNLVEAFGFQPVEAVPALADEEIPKPGDQMRPAEKKGMKKWIPWVLAFCVLTALALMLVKLPAKKQPGPEKKEIIPPKETTAPSTADSAASAASSVLKQDTSGTAEDIIAKGLEKRLYYLIGGSFQSEQNANEYLLNMKNLGYAPVSLGRIGRFYMVSIESYASEKEAMHAVNRLNNTHPEAGFWIYHPQ